MLRRTSKGARSGKSDLSPALRFLLKLFPRAKATLASCLCSAIWERCGRPTGSGSPLLSLEVPAAMPVTPEEVQKVGGFCPPQIARPRPQSALCCVAAPLCQPAAQPRGGLPPAVFCQRTPFFLPFTHLRRLAVATPGLAGGAATCRSAPDSYPAGPGALPWAQRPLRPPFALLLVP